MAGVNASTRNPCADVASSSQPRSGRSSTSCRFSTFFATSQIEIIEIDRPSLSTAAAMAAAARRERRRSSVTHQTHACVSRTVGIPFLPRPEWTARLFQNAAGERLGAFPRTGERHDRGDGATALRHDNGRPGRSDVVEDFQTAILEPPGWNPVHTGNIAMATWLCQLFTPHNAFPRVSRRRDPTDHERGDKETGSEQERDARQVDARTDAERERPCEQ